MGIRVGYIAYSQTVNAYYRCIGPIAAMADRGHWMAEVMSPGRPANLDVLRECDLLHVHRFCQGDAYRAMRWAREQGVPVVWDNDDDMFAPPKGRQRAQGAWTAFSRQELIGATRRVFRLASAVTTPSEELAATFEENGAHDVHVIENHIPQEFVVPLRRRPQQTVTIGWIGALEHEIDARELRIGQALARLMELRPEVRVTTVGVDLGLPRGRYQRVRPLPFGDLLQWTASFDVGIAPLADIRLNRARSNVKLKEYAAAGVPWLASPVGPYLGMGEHEGGRLVHEDRWLEELTRLVVDPAERDRLGAAGQRWAREQTIDRHVDEWERLFVGLIERARVGGRA